jgi:hypothetical protein
MNNSRIAQPSISTYSIERQKHVEHAAMALWSLRRSYAKTAAITRYDVLANPKSESCTEETLGRKEGVENAFHNLRRNAASVDGMAGKHDSSGIWLKGPRGIVTFYEMNPDDGAAFRFASGAGNDLCSLGNAPHRETTATGAGSQPRAERTAAANSLSSP